jgi:hypothetical protein
VPHHLEALPPCLAPVLGFGQFGQVDDEVRGDAGQALVRVARIERPEAGAYQFGVLGGRGDLRPARCACLIKPTARRTAAAWAGAKSA